MPSRFERENLRVESNGELTVLVGLDSGHLFELTAEDVRWLALTVLPAILCLPPPPEAKSEPKRKGEQGQLDVGS